MHDYCHVPGTPYNRIHCHCVYTHCSHAVGSPSCLSVWSCLQARFKQLAALYRQLLQQLDVTATSSWRGTVKDDVKAAIAKHNKQQQHGRDGSASAAAGDADEELQPAAAAAALEDSQREQLFREYVAELSKQQAR